MKVCIVYRKEKLTNEKQVDDIAEAFISRGVEVSLTRTYSPEEKADVVFVLGGDGMVLHAAATACRCGARVIGVNYGNLGFLTEFEWRDTLSAVELVCSKNYGVLSRAVIEVSLGGKTAYSLNEISINRDPTAKGVKQMVKFNVEVAGDGNEEFIADGVIVCTPTGSTAYSLSAGGCVLAPDVPAFMITPVCSFSLWSRPIAYSDGKVLTVRLGREMDKCAVFADGKPFSAFSYGDCITIRKADFTADFIVAKNRSFFERLNKKVFD